MTRLAHCAYCGQRFPEAAPWPRTCAACGETSYLNPIPVTVVLVPIAAGLLAVRRAIEPGLFQVYARLRADRMRGAYAPDKSDYYYLEAVPYVLYFDGDRALHGEYWHDRLGFKRSHGCVNLACLQTSLSFPTRVATH